MHKPGSSSCCPICFILNQKRKELLSWVVGFFRAVMKEKAWLQYWLGFCGSFWIVIRCTGLYWQVWEKKKRILRWQGPGTPLLLFLNSYFISLIMTSKIHKKLTCKMKYMSESPDIFSCRQNYENVYFFSSLRCLPKSDRYGILKWRDLLLILGLGSKFILNKLM